MPVDDLTQHFSKSLGTHTEELYSMAGLVFLTDFFDWNASGGRESILNPDTSNTPLNLEPGATLCTRTLERYQQLFRDNDLAARVFDKVTTKLVNALRPQRLPRQRLDSTHVFSHMATFGRTKLMAVAIKQFSDPTPAARQRRLHRAPRRLSRPLHAGERNSSPTPKTPTPAHATVSKPPKTSTSSSPASPIDPTTPIDRPIKR